jgi:integrase
MPKLATPLTAAKVKTAGPGRYFDGDGLVLLVRKAPRAGEPDRAFWLFRYTGNERIREAGLGRARGPNAVSLADARERARRLKDRVREGKDPLAERDAEKATAKADAARATATAMTFAQVADMFIAAHEAGWRNPKHRQQWRNTLRDYVLPSIGDLPVGNIDTSVVMRILEPLWREKVETATRVRGRIESCLDYARARGWREGENPARWRGHLDHLLPRRSKVRRVEHHAALPWREIGAFMAVLRSNSSISARCLEFVVLTAGRSGEARGARWREIDLAHAVWTIPASRMKAAKEHRVPLPDPAVGVLRQMAELGREPGAFVFPGLSPDRPLSDRALAQVVDAIGEANATVHGFRSTFRDWCAETTNHPRELAEAALAHTLSDKVEAAYLRGDLLERRRALMSAWATFCGKPLQLSEVVPLRAAAAG